MNTRLSPKRRCGQPIHSIATVLPAQRFSPVNLTPSDAPYRGARAATWTFDFGPTLGLSSQGGVRLVHMSDEQRRARIIDWMHAVGDPWMAAGSDHAQSGPKLPSDDEGT